MSGGALGAATGSTVRLRWRLTVRSNMLARAVRAGDLPRVLTLADEIRAMVEASAQDAPEQLTLAPETRAAC